MKRESVSPDPAWKGLYGAGAISSLLVGILFIVAFFLFGVLGPLASTTEGVLKQIAANRLTFITAQGVLVVATILAIPTILALYIALRDVNKSYMLIAATVFGISTTLALASPFTPLGLLTLSDKYAAATTDAQRAVYVTAAEAVQANSGGGPASGILLAVALIIIGLVMLKGVFDRATAYLGIVLGILLFISLLPAIGFLFIVLIPLAAVWFLAVGFRLYKISGDLHLS